MSFCLNSGICSSTYKKSRWHNESNELGVCYSRKERGKTYRSPNFSLLVKSNLSCLCITQTTENLTYM